MSTNMEVNDAFLKQYNKCFSESSRQLTPVLQVIGGGKMALALVEGFVTAGFFSKKNVFICAQTEATVNRWNEAGYNALKSTEFYSLNKPTGIILICVKPQIFYDGVHSDIRKWIGSNYLANIIVISVMAGVTLQTLRSHIGLNVVRLMPSISCTTGEGSLIVAGASNLKVQERESVNLTLIMGSKLGYCVEVNEKQFDAAAVLSGSGPAFIFLVIEALADGGVLCGLSRELSLKLAANTVKGAAQLFLKTNKPLGQLKDEVCSPAGTTIAGIRELEKAGVRSALIESVAASKKRAVELSLD